MPTGKPAKTEEEIEASRRENARQFEEQADTRNENRGVVKKVFGIGKESGIDIAQEEASRINRLVDQKIERDGAETSAQTASEEIARSSEFDRKDEATIKAEEFLKSKNPDIAKSLQGGDIASARAAFEKVFGKVKDDNEKRSLRKGFEKMATDQIDTLIKSNDLPGMKVFVQKNELHDIGLGNLALMPQEVIQTKEVQDKLTNQIRGYFSNSSPEAGVKRANEIVSLGLMKKEDKEKLFASDQYQKDLQAQIRGYFSNSSPEAGVKRANEIVKMGIMTNERAQQIIDELKAKRRTA
ncbi:MAG: hypothetical protein Q7R91_00005 [bacterium]|nr:hypothetical protein [bacterium]